MPTIPAKIVHPRRTPKYRFHKHTGQAYVELNGQRLYLGKYDAPATREAYHRLIAEWEAGGRRLATPPAEITIVEVIERFWQYAKTIYRKPDGSPTKELETYKQVLRPLKALYANTKAADFGPRAIKAVRLKLVGLGWARSHINKQVSRLKTVFRWATEEELIPSNVFHALLAVRGLQRGQTEARETAPVRPVPEDLITPLKAILSDQVWALIQVQLRTGCRPDEAVRLRAVDFTNTSAEVWTVNYQEHKTARFGIAKTIFLGPQAKKVVAPFMENRPISDYLFSPVEAEAQRRRQLTEARITPASCGNRPGTNRSKRPEREPQDHYTVDSYRRAIERACDEAFPPPGPLGRIKVTGRKSEDASRWETDAEWKTRLGTENWAEVKAWRKAHRWSPTIVAQHHPVSMQD